MTTTSIETAAMRRALALAASPGVPTGPNPRVGCVLLDDRGPHRRRGLAPRRRLAARRGRRAAPGGRRRSRGDRRRHARAVQPHRAHRSVRAGAGRGRRTTRGVRPARPQPGRRRGSGHPARRGVEVEGGLLEDEARRRQPGVDLRDGPRPAVRDLEVRHHARRPQRRRRRHQPLGLLAGRAGRHPPSPGAVRHDARRQQHGRGRRPAARRCATRDDRPLDVQPLRAVMGLRDLPARPAGLRRVRAHRPPAHPRPPRGAQGAVRARPPARLPRGRADAGRGVLAGRTRRRGRHVRRPDAARLRPRGRGRPGHRHHRRRRPPHRHRRHRPRPARARRRRQRPLHHDPIVSLVEEGASAPVSRPRNRLRRPENVHRHRRGARHRRRGRGPGRRPAPDRPRDDRARGHRPRRLDRGQRLLPDRGRHRRTTPGPPTSCRRPSTRPRCWASRPATASTSSGR